jgi:membrane-associated phospholipid phosphatase
MPEHAYTAGALPRGRRIEYPRRPGAGGALGVAALCVVALALIWLVAELVPAAQVRDAVVLHDFMRLSGPQIDPFARLLLHLLDPPLFTIWGVALVLFAISRGRPRVALAIALVMALAPLSSELLKPLLAHAHDTRRVGPASWPSGHSTAASALALCAVLVAPRRWRTAVAALGGAFVLAVGAALLIRAWHMPSDVLGGWVMGVLWMSLAVAALRGSQRRWPPRERKRSAGSEAPAQGEAVGRQP